MELLSDSLVTNPSLLDVETGQAYEHLHLPCRDHGRTVLCF